MGKVYLAHQISMDRNVALKVLGAEILTLPRLVQRFQNEVRMAALVDHANIVKAFGAGEDGGFHYLAMEYVSGGSLRERLEREGFLPERDALEITYKVATALREAWEDHRILHRDIKPENIMLTDRGEPKLADLGLSKSLIEDSKLTAAFSTLGSPSYMSPEQAKGLPDADTRSDMYSLGTTLYQMVTGMVPFDGRSAPDTLRMLVAESLPPPQQIKPEISDGCVVLLEGMLAKNPDRRYQEWNSLIADIHRIRNGTMPAGASPAEDDSEGVQAEEIPVFRQDGHLAGPVSNARRGNSLRMSLTTGVAVTLLFVAVMVVFVLSLTGGLGGSLGHKFGLPFAPGKKSSQAGNRSEEEKATDAAAEETFWALIRTAGLPTVDADQNSIASLARERRFSETEVEMIRERIESLTPTFTESEIGKKYSHVIDLLRCVVPNIPLYADQQMVDRTLKQLQEDNAGATRPFYAKIENDGIVLDLSVNPDLDNISALKGLPLKSLDISNTSVSRIEPLAGVPLVRLDAHDSKIEDIRPLTGMRLQYLDIGKSYDAEIDISPLRGMPLEHLNLRRIKHPNLEVLSGMPIKFLHLGSTEVEDLSPLKGMPLEHLEIFRTEVTSLVPLHRAPLRYLKGEAKFSDNELVDLRVCLKERFGMNLIFER
jgi:hypothetical protein